MTMNGTTIAEASATLTPFAQNVLSQGPGGQAWELAPTSPGKPKVDTPVPLKAKVKKKAKKKLANVVRTLAEKAGDVAKPALEEPKLTLACAGALAFTGLAAFLFARRRRE